jgi:predicted dehydrogenase/threonine dehydrogenase-like Zn-dependent dehydrogenase
MKQVLQNVRSGQTEVKEIPAPLALPGHVVVAAMASVISAGTERYVVDLARRSLIGKARQRPEDIKRVFQKLRQEGIATTITQVLAKLDDPMPLGYSLAGIVLECGAGVQEFKPGDRIAAAAPHSAIAVVGRNLCAPIPENVSFEQAAYTSIAAIGLQGVRLSQTNLGESVLVVGLGLIGQICVCLLKAQGCRVFGIDLDPAKLELARTLGADTVATGFPLQAVKDFSGSFGVDSVVLTAATESNEPIEFAADVCRPKGRIVLVGVVGLRLPRPPFFKKELEFTVSSSLGPGRGDPVYEEKGVDYPVGYARWTAQRNMQAVLDLMSQGKLPVERLTSHRFPIDQAADAYDLITSGREPFLGLVLEYPHSTEKPRRRIKLKTTACPSNALGVSFFGAGNFARLVMLPALTKMSGIAWRGICTAKGFHAEHTGRSTGFEFATTDGGEIWNDKDTAVVFIATRHDLHADLVIAALRAGKHVFVEKPLCIHAEELTRIAACVEELGDACPILTVGFNRRFAPATQWVREFFEGVRPLSLSYRFSPPYIPRDHWTQDEEVGGGRIVGEACHAIDTCVAIAGSPPIKVFAESVVKNGLETSDDRVFITLRHADGSVSSISYQTGGDGAFPAERIEILGGGRTAVIDGWQDVELWRNGKQKRRPAKRDKGHQEEFAVFLSACRTGGPAPIPWDHLYGVTWASLMAVRSLREGCPYTVEAFQEQSFQEEV